MACAAGGHCRIGAHHSRARALGTGSGRTDSHELAVGRDGDRRADPRAGRVDHANGRARLQPLHLLSILMEPAATTIPSPWNRVLAIVFALAISVPLIGNLAGLDGADAYEEHRSLAVFPDLATFPAHPLAFLNGVSGWFEDHFAFRSRLVRWYGESRFLGLHQSPNQTVALGRDGWLFYLDDRSLDDYINEKPLTASDIAGWRDILLGEHQWLAEHGVAFVFTIAPDKHVIYPEEFPQSVRPVRDTSRTDQLFQALRGSPVPAIDVRPALLEAKARERVYFKTDTHWNDRGAYAAYRQIIDAVCGQDPRVPPAW